VQNVICFISFYLLLFSSFYLFIEDLCIGNGRSWMRHWSSWAGGSWKGQCVICIVHFNLCSIGL